MGYYNPVAIHFGNGIYLETLQQILGVKRLRVGLFYGKNAMKRAGVIDDIRNILPRCEIYDHGGILPNPDIVDMPRRLDCRDFDWIIGIGGGSVLDTAKAAAFMARQREPQIAFLSHTNTELPRRSVPFIAIPTTSGTGSETTPWATIWDRHSKIKYSLSFREMFPMHAIVDPELTYNLPKHITVYTGCDALSHAIEARWSKNANPVSTGFANVAIPLLLSGLQEVTGGHISADVRHRLSRGSLLAGRAFSNTWTTAVHAVSYPMTLHWEVPHGIACALTLAQFCRYNGEEDAFAKEIEELIKSIGLPTTLKAAGIPWEGIDVIVNEGFHPDRIGNNPREVTRDALRRMLEEIYE